LAASSFTCFHYYLKLLFNFIVLKKRRHMIRSFLNHWRLPLLFMCGYSSQQYCVKNAFSIFCFEIESSYSWKESGRTHTTSTIIQNVNKKKVNKHSKNQTLLPSYAEACHEFVLQCVYQRHTPRKHSWLCRCWSGGEYFATLCKIWPAWDLKSRPSVCIRSTHANCSTFEAVKKCPKFFGKKWLHYKTYAPLIKETWQTGMWKQSRLCIYPLRQSPEYKSVKRIRLDHFNTNTYLLLLPVAQDNLSFRATCYPRLKENE